MSIKTSTSRKTIVEAINAMHPAFARLRELQAEAEKCWQALQQIDARDKWLLVFDAEYNRIQSEWDKAFTEFNRLAAEASDLIIEENARQFGAWDHRHRTNKRFTKRDGLSTRLATANPPPPRIAGLMK